MSALNERTDFHLVVGLEKRIAKLEALLNRIADMCATNPYSPLTDTMRQLIEQELKS